VFSFQHGIWPGIFFASAFLIPTSPSAAGTDFLVVEKVERLQIYNKYQQEISASERQRVSPFAPMKILKIDDMLGDGFTPCMQVEIDGEVFFLLKEKEGSLARTGSLGFIETFRNATPLFDSAKVLRDHSLFFTPTNSSRRLSLVTNERILRIFQHGNLTYSRRLTGQTAYGWIELTEKSKERNWMVLKSTASASDSIPGDIVQKVHARVDEVNRVLVRLFEHFNKQFHQQKPIPQWSLESSDKTLSCLLQGTTEPESFQESTRYLISDIENIVLGAELQVVLSPGRIEVRPK
jgi:hypothetical protein